MQIEGSVEDESLDQQLLEYEASWRTFEDLGDLLMDCDGDPLQAAETMTCQLAASWLGPLGTCHRIRGRCEAGLMIDQLNAFEKRAGFIVFYESRSGLAPSFLF